VVGSAAAHLLLIEDEPAVARLTELLLKDAGYSVDLLADHGEASNLLNERQFDLVLCDTDLGARTAGLSGLVPLVHAASPSPVVLFSAHRFSAGEIAAAGLAGVIRKPYDIDDLLRVVEKNIAGSGPAGSDENQATPV
jgi:DNA-binding response OmpR family regulator